MPIKQFCYCGITLQANDYDQCYACRSANRINLRRERRNHKVLVRELQEKIQGYAKENNIKTKCMADEIMLYCRYAISKLEIGDSEKTQVLETCERFHKERIRGKMEYTNKLPRTLATAIVYISCVEAGITSPTYLTNQRQIAETLYVTETSLRTNYNFIVKNENLKRQNETTWERILRKSRA